VAVQRITFLTPPAGTTSTHAVVHRPCLNQSKRRADFRPSAIVVHIMAGSMSGTQAWFNDKASRASAHYGISKLGQIVQWVHPSRMAWHAGRVKNLNWPWAVKQYGIGVSPNQFTIGIEHEIRNLDEVWPAPMVEASCVLIRYLCDWYGIVISEDTVVPHNQINALHACPGPKAPLGYIRDHAKMIGPVHRTGDAL
jgi:N-acetyl-anhydromuramyl-L-alanine amidase AmpD